MTSFLARLEKLSRDGLARELLKKTDVTPPSVYQNLKDASTVFANPETHIAFFLSRELLN